MLEIKDIAYKYSRRATFVLNGIDCVFDSGKVYSITGESGAGKSTFISLLAALDKPTRGEILFDGKNISKINPTDYRLRKIGLVFQGNNLILRRSAIDNVELSLYLNKIKQPQRSRRAAELLESVNLTPDKHHRIILNLSGGEQQRVAIARAIANDPDIIIADEPTGNLDEGNAEQVMALLQNEAYTKNRCVILVTHNNSLAARADTHYRLAGGKIIC